MGLWNIWFGILGILGFLLTSIGLYNGLFIAPPDILQGENVRIIYIHVPSAWISLFLYASLAVAGFTLLVWKHLLADFYIKSAAPVGAGFALICLVTGAIWGYPTWGTYWVWDARLTSMLILFFLYLGVIGISSAYDNKNLGSQAAAWLAIIGSVNLPIIKFSVDWWQTLHQPASISSFETFSNPKIHSSFSQPLLISALGLTCLARHLILRRMKTYLYKTKKQSTSKRHTVTHFKTMEGSNT